MYTGKLTLTNTRRVPLSLSNSFDDTFGMADEIKRCKSAEEYCSIANKYHRYGMTWSIDSDSSQNTRLVTKDWLGNVTYLVANKQAESSLKNISDGELIEELISRGYKIHK